MRPISNWQYYCHILVCSMLCVDASVTKVKSVETWLRGNKLPSNPGKWSVFPREFQFVSVLFLFLLLKHLCL
ncbi:hypothetical protein BDQ94DRAFT_154061 [Aspergillus welwitschiae]|uniref:Secreted protein n=1 Tax=Aspergillus welwitschiae TaxID=1341132 RepID=A0A3F3PKH3_9EURO|nr:hypothetical protein BDQ94DRAFT_154061 [Aspergillus welwitschiae]RDH27378.1 hypothetical protein BDQ94DRAFT_154061 [Aspergillus welwitschiae]